MTVNPESIREVVRLVNQEIDSTSKTLDQRMKTVLREALDKLAQLPLTSFMDSVSLIALGSRISILSQGEDLVACESLFERACPRTETSSKYDFLALNFNDALSQECLAKAKSISKEGIVDILKKLGEISDDERDDILQSIGPYLNERMNSVAIISILNAIKSVPVEERSFFYQITKPFLKESIDNYTLCTILSFVSEIHPKEREIFCLEIIPFLKKGMNGRIITEVIRATSAIPLREKISIFQGADLFFKSNMNSVVMNMILRAAISVDLDERCDFYLAANSLLKDVTDSYEICTVLNMLADLSFTQRESFCLAMKVILKENMSRDEIESILETLSSIPREERVEVVQSTASFLRDSQDGCDVVSILTVIASTPAEERDRFYQNASLFLQDSMKGHDLVFILNAIFIISKEDRQEVFRLAKPLIKEHMRGSDISSILMGIDELPRKDREDLIRVSAPLIKDSERGSLISSVLKTVADLPKKDREHVIRVSAPLIKEHMSTSDISSILTTVANLPEQARELFAECIERIRNYRNEDIADSLEIMIFDKGDLEGYIEALFRLVLFKTTSANRLMAFKILPSVVLAKWIAEAETEEIEAPALENFISSLTSFLDESKDDLKNNTHFLMQTFLMTELSLDRVEEFSSSKKLQLLSCVSNSTAGLTGFRLITSLCMRNNIEKLNNIPLKSPLKELTEAFEESLVEDPFINLLGIENLTNRYTESFMLTREPLALEVYMSGLRSSRSLEVKISLERFVRSVLLGTFEHERYDTSGNNHLKTIQNYDKDNQKAVLEQWKSLTFEVPVHSMLEALEEKKFSYEGFFKEKLRDGHGTRDKILYLPNLSFFLDATLEEKKKLFQAMREEIESTSREIQEISLDKKKELALKLKMVRAEGLCMELILNVDLPKKDQIQKIESVSSALSSLKLEFGADLQGLARMFKASQRSSEAETVKLCKGWEDLFLSGTEVSGSCQRVDGDPGLNKCLLAYCLDGKNAMLAVKGRDGKILARSMLRLLWNQTDSKPVLFLDRLYPSPCSKERESAIEIGAKECARALNLELFISSSEDLPSEKAIASLGSSCPFEYADGTDEGVTEGVFIVRNARKIEIEEV